MNKNFKIVVAVHKPYDVLWDETYLPVHAGAARAEAIGYERDDQGLSISEKNDLYCELTVLYWAWKNLPAKTLGLMYYRRYLGTPMRYFLWKGKRDRIATGKELQRYLKKHQLSCQKSETTILKAGKISTFMHMGRLELMCFELCLNVVLQNIYPRLSIP